MNEQTQPPETSEPSTQETTSKIVLQPMPQQLEALGPTDDWTGTNNPAVRRRVQNRLAQRAYRKKRLRTLHFHCQSDSDVESQMQTPYGIVLRLVRCVQLQHPQGRGCHLELPGVRPRLDQFVRQAYQDYALASPRPAALQTLVQLNVLRALAQNAAALGLTIPALCAEDTLSPFNYAGPNRPEHLSLPYSLQSTPQQTAVRHHPWIDLFPLPEMRNSILQLCGPAEEEDLCIDLIDVEENDHEKPNLVVWGDPSDPQAWEATIPFLRKWGWVVRDCQGLLQSTNSWREKRGEQKLIFEVS